MNGIQKLCTGEARTPDLVEEIFAYRLFGLDSCGRLSALRFPQYWKPGENIATCMVESSISTDQSTSSYYNCTVPTPNLDCTCGFYAFYDSSAEDIHNNSTDWPDQMLVRGVIAAYGKVLVGTKGIRAEKARIVAVAPDGASRLRKTERWDLMEKLYPDVPAYSKAYKMVASYPIYRPALNLTEKSFGNGSKTQS